MHRYRSHTCGALRAADIGADTRLSGWVHRVRDHGGVLFIDLRDHYGLTQCVADPDSPAFKDAEKLRSEWVVRIDGKVRRRPDGTDNPELPTGMVELYVSEIEVLGPAGELPLPVFGEQEYPEDIRLKFRFLDLRREKLHQNIMTRGAIVDSMRKRMKEQGFFEFQTPILTASSPEGARDFLVPSRIHPGKFYALPQAPQQFKQLIMVAGITLLIGLLIVGLNSSLSATAAQRIEDFIRGLINPVAASDHIQRSVDSIVRGGFFGVGIGLGEVKNTGLPVAHTDSIFAVIAEETGLLGSILTILLYIGLMWRGLTIASRAADLEGKLLEMDLGKLFSMWLETSLVGITIWALNICIFVIVYGRMIEIYLVTSVGPIPMATMVNREWGGMGQNYLRSLLALAFQAFLIMVCVGIYAVLCPAGGCCRHVW
mgnify:CR=1 FL=1